MQEIPQACDEEEGRAARGQHGGLQGGVPRKCGANDEPRHRPVLPLDQLMRVAIDGLDGIGTGMALAAMALFQELSPFDF